jgi:hypothetical protein
MAGFAAAIFFLLVLLQTILSWFGYTDSVPSLVFGVAYLLFPLAIGIAITRYRLFDIDIIIRKTLIYTIVVAIWLVVYLGGVILLQQIFANVSGQRSEIITVLSTLAIAALFIPLRNKIQNAIDKRFYRNKYDAQKVLQAFAETVRDETDLEKLTARLMQVVDETMQPTNVSVWLASDKIEQNIREKI